MKAGKVWKRACDLD